MATTTVYGSGAQIAQNDSDIADVVGGVNANATHTKGTPLSATGLTVTEMGDGAFHKTIFTFSEVDMTITDGTTPATDGAWGTLELYTFPEGYIRFFAAHAVFPLGGLEATTGGGTGLSDTSDFEIGLGTVASSNVTDFGLQDGTQEDIIAALDVDLTSGTSDAAESDSNVTAATFDGHSSAATLNLNVRTLDDADCGASGDTLKISGTITVLWTSFGDD